MPIYVLPLLIGVLGIILSNGWIRLVLWLLSVPLCYFGVLVLDKHFGPEPFSPTQTVIWCVFLFWPLAGCMIGEVLKYRRKGAASKDS